ncbi:MAG TPA: hypothetical protein VMN37_09385 [Gemmatimonadales bacterium]|nr:hypothetical protein [Gemmatimonadales bacterium]
MLRCLLLTAAAGLVAAAGCSAPSSLSPEGVRAQAGPPGAGTPTLTPQTSGTTNRLQAISVVSPRIAWASGLGGTYVVTTDGGETWRPGVVPGAEALQFRDVEAVNARVAYLMAAGSGADSRIFKTEDGGATWTLQFQNQSPDAFYDCFAFWSPRRGFVFSDAVDGRFPVLRTTDGEMWVDIGDQLPEAQPGEAAFAASGTCVATQGGQRGWIMTGAAERSRVFATTDGGDTWEAYDAPIVQGTPASGGFTIDFRDPFHGILAGGDLDDAGVPTDNVAVSSDGGRTWELAAPTPFPGAAFGLAYVRGLGQRTVVVTGPGGAAWSSDEGGSWTLLSGVENYWAVAFASSQAGWLVGTEGRILKIGF